MIVVVFVWYDWLVFYVFCMGVLMIVLDIMIVNVVLFLIKVDLGFFEIVLVWVVNVYMFIYGGFLLLVGWFGDLFGYCCVFLFGFVVFMVVLLLCGLVVLQWMLVVVCVVQGLGGVVVLVVVLLLIMDLFMVLVDCVWVMGIYGFVCVGGGSVGVLFGGFFMSVLSWYWIFLVNLLIGVLVVLVILWLVLVMCKLFEGCFDVVGVVSVMFVLVLVIYFVVYGNEVGWMLFVMLGVLVVVLVLLVVFVIIEVCICVLLILFGLFCYCNFMVVSLIGVLWCVVMFVWFFFLVLYMQQVLGYDLFCVGLVFLLVNLVMVVCLVGLFV